MSYQPREYQRPFWQTFGPIIHDWETAPIKRGILVWHRRAGKDMTALNFAETAMKTRSGSYFHFLPTYTQAKKIIWDGKDKQGRPFLANFDERLIVAKHETELKITYGPTPMAPYGSTYQLIGGDQFDTNVGTNPVGCIFSEYPIMNPKAWDLVRPILRENGGWALFVFTPRGKNHGFKLWNETRNNPRWFRSLLTIEDTGVMSAEDMQDERDSGMTEELLQQEFYCSFEGAMEGAYYADQLAAAERDGRIGSVPYDPAYPVDTAWDLGLNDEMSVWFTQHVGPNRHHVIDYMEGSSKGLDFYIHELRRRPYEYGRHYAPHDIAHRELTSGNTRQQIVAREHGLYFEAQPKLSFQDGIEATRRLLPVSWFDAEKCARGLDALRSYRREKDEKLGTFKDSHVHDWASNGADAFRTRAVAWRSVIGGGTSQKFADIRYRLHHKHEQQQEYADTSWRRDVAPDARGVQVEAEYGDPWWRD